ncbi:MAG: cobalamin-dependent protein [Gemmatimonadaceae bacterium]
MNSRSAPIRVLLVKPTHDCHDRGVRYVARKFRDAGFEVIFANFLLPAEIVKIAVEEDVNAIGVSVSSGGHMNVFREVTTALESSGVTDALLFGGGVIPKEDQAELKQLGVAAIFGPGSAVEEAVAMIRQWAVQNE